MSSGISFFITNAQATEASFYRIKFVQHCLKMSCKQSNIVGEACFMFIFLSYDDKCMNIYANDVLLLMSG